MTIEATKKNLDAVCLPDAPYLGERLAAVKPAGVLSMQAELEGEDWDGVPLCHNDQGATIIVVGLVNLKWRAIKYMTGAEAVEALGEVIGPQQAAEFMNVDAPVYFHGLKLCEYYGSAGMPPSSVETPELSAGALAKSAAVDLEKMPTRPLHRAFSALESSYTSGEAVTAQQRDQARQIFSVLQKRLPHLPADSPLLKEIKPAEQAKPHLSRIVKSAGTADPEWMYVLSMVLCPNDGKDGADLNPDFDGEIYDRHLIRKMAYPYVHKYRGLGIMHQGEAVTDDVARVVQCYVVDDGFTLTDDSGTNWGPGTWFLGAEVKRSSDLGKRIESGEIGAWSIDGIALKIPEKVAA